MADDFEYLWGKRHDVLYRIELSTLYHQKRERFFEACDKVAKAVAVIGGSWSLARLGGESAMLLVAAAITVTSTVSLVFGLSDRARRHAALAADFRRMEAEVVGRGEYAFSEADLADWSARLRLLEATEPAALGNLVRLCQNELAVAQGQPSKVRRVGLVRYLLAHWVDLPLASG